MPFITLVENQSKSLAVGQVLSLKPVDDNVTDPFAVGVYDNAGAQLGWVANAKNTVIDGTLGAKEVRQRWLENPKCAGVNVLVRKDGTFQNSAGVAQVRYCAEAFLIPVRETAKKEEKKEEEEVKVKRYQVGGQVLTNPCKHAVQDLILQWQTTGEVPEADLVLAKAEIPGIRLFFRDDTSAGAAGGEVQNPDPELEAFLANGQVLAAKLVCENGHKTKANPSAPSSFEVEVSFAPQDNIVVSDISRFYAAIDAAVARCVSQSPVLEKKVQHMMANHFDDAQINEVLTSLQPLGDERASVPKPGTLYHQDNGYNLSDVVTYMMDGKTVRLVGEKGSGKNTLVETACWLLNRPLCRIQGSAETEKMDFLGARTLKDGCTGFELSEMLQTLINNGVVVVDEANMVRPDVLSLLHSLTDGARSITVPGYGEVHMGDRACILYTLNEGYVGTGEMNPATIDRGPTVIVQQEEQLSTLLKMAVPNAAEKDVDTCCKVSDAIRKAVKESGELTPDAITIRGYIDALSTRIPLRRALIQNVANKAQSVQERTAMETIITSFCGFN